MKASQVTRLHRRVSHQDPCRPRLLRVEPLEDRRLLTAARAADAINLFAYDVYEHMQNESGNLFFSPLSVATALSMTYAGAVGQTAAEMEQVLHLGSEPGIHSSFSDLLSIFETQSSTIANFDLAVANAIWPGVNVPINGNYIDTIETNYLGHVQNLNYGNPNQARNIINAWIEDQTNGKIEDMIDELSPDTAMVLTNAVYFKALWEHPFDPENNFNDSFYVNSDETIFTEYMFTDVEATRIRLGGFDVIDLPFEGGASSMIFVKPTVRNGPNELTPELFSQIDAWLESERESYQMEVSLPKFETTVDTNLKQLLIGMGMSSAFGDADFSGMTDAGVWIEKVYHKATIELNEQGTEAAAATVVELPLCFAAGTPILTPDGEKLIEDLKAGDFVLARDEYNLEGEVQSKLVERLLTGEADILELYAGGQTIRTTSLHPFFVRGRGWTPAGEIMVEDRLSTNHGDWIEVEKVLHTGSSEAVYNLRVADHHTYFVGSRTWKFGLWVHNYYGTGFYADHPFHMMIRDNETSTITFMGRIDNPTQSSNDVNPAVVQTPTSADFDGDGDIDGRDFLAWQRGHGMTSNALRANGDSNNDGDVDTGDLETWQASYGQTASPQLAALADAALDNSWPLVGWLTEGVAANDEALGMERPLILDSVSDPADMVAISTQSPPVDASISSHGRYDQASDDGASWLDDELLERVFG